eukprot:2611007-Amphidinium_carterae.1
MEGVEGEVQSMHTAAESDGPSQTPQTVHLAELTPEESFQLMTQDFVGMTPTQAKKYWAGDAMRIVAHGHAP